MNFHSSIIEHLYRQHLDLWRANGYEPNKSFHVDFRADNHKVFRAELYASSNYVSVHLRKLEDEGKQLIAPRWGIPSLHGLHDSCWRDSLQTIIRELQPKALYGDNPVGFIEVDPEEYRKFQDRDKYMFAPGMRDDILKENSSDLRRNEVLFALKLIDHLRQGQNYFLIFRGAYNKTWKLEIINRGEGRAPATYIRYNFRAKNPKTGRFDLLSEPVFIQNWLCIYAIQNVERLDPIYIDHVFDDCGGYKSMGVLENVDISQYPDSQGLFREQVIENLGKLIKIAKKESKGDT